jgi:hypothetical protein
MLRLCWADKIVLVPCLMWLIVIFMLGYDPNYSHSPNNDPLNTLEFTAFIFGPVWLFARMIDLMIGGPGRRRGQIRAHLVRAE